MCDFCKIINKQLPAYVVYEDEQLISFLDIDPIHDGHILIVPKKHVDSIEKLSDEELIDIMGVARKLVVAFKDIYGNDGYSIIQNGGKFCDYGHAHFHVFPRYDNDGFGWTHPKGKSEYSERVAKSLRDNL